jgi:uncharacterized protein YbjQ (UPF0145 family)
MVQIRNYIKQNWNSSMLMTTTSTIESQPVRQYLGVVTGEYIVGGRSGAYENSLRDARQTALAELAEEARRLGADGVIGIDLDYEVLGKEGSMLMVTASGTAVKLG